ncbi:transcriptional regulator, AraC family [Clostridium cavendishii DSM 21758]|uniref:Transcriptional regulator, AraC family n=1 Tax=Clostridium cavendishii DSM 21758 TaxID=1121302 RepID=A0A1M6J109_9CLOT|nr:AraC family transcriptional regulator [Clostridium cavendishii]SHJ40408.1 transcriptional regulator, AraC family [Clostridium cavendishii DSM 21758]
MDWVNRMKNALDYIENNLTGDICYEEAAKIAYCSTYQFQRMFSYITDVSLAEYIRRRRLTLAAFEIRQTDAKIIDIALKYGYDSPTAFTRAFQSLHGITPKLARSKGVSLKAYPRISFQIQIKGAVEMNYRIEEKDRFRVVGIKEKISTVDDQNFIKVPKLWREVFSSGKCEEIVSLMNKGENSDIYGICANYSEKDKAFDYFIASITDKDVPKDMEELIIPKSTWAIFECTGPMPDSMKSLLKRIYTEWFPSSGYEHGNTPELERYPAGDSSLEDYKSEIWIPIIPKK